MIEENFGIGSNIWEWKGQEKVMSQELTTQLEIEQTLVLEDLQIGRHPADSLLRIYSLLNIVLTKQGCLVSHDKAKSSRKCLRNKNLLPSFPCFTMQ